MPGPPSVLECIRLPSAALQRRLEYRRALRIPMPNRRPTAKNSQISSVSRHTSQSSSNGSGRGTVVRGGCSERGLLLTPPGGSFFIILFASGGSMFSDRGCSQQCSSVSFHVPAIHCMTLPTWHSRFPWTQLPDMARPGTKNSIASTNVTLLNIFIFFAAIASSRKDWGSGSAKASLLSPL